MVHDVELDELLPAEQPPEEQAAILPVIPDRATEPIPKTATVARAPGASTIARSYMPPRCEMSHPRR
jgi:hypothetical protein